MSTLKVGGIRGASASADAITFNATDGTCTVKATNNLSNRNLVINGAMKVAQRGDVTGVEYGYGACDRWRFSGGSAARITMNQTAGPTAEGFAYSQEFDVTTADASLAAGDYNMLSYKWEGQDLQQIKKGQSGAESLTVSFWVSSPKTGTHILELYDQANSRQISKAYSVSSANTWEKKTVTFAGDTTGTIANTTAAGLTLEFWLCAGSTYSSGTLNTSWAAITNANRAVGQVNSDTFYAFGRGNGTADFVFSVPLNVPLRASPTITQSVDSGNWKVFGNSYADNSSNTPVVRRWQANAPTICLNCLGFDALVDDRCGTIQANFGASGRFTLSAEL
jgi:hypothetical protein